MKKLLVVVVASLMFGALAQAADEFVVGADVSAHETESFKLTKLDINPNSYIFRNQKVIGGSVVVDHTTKEVIATFYRPMPECPKGAFCAQIRMMPAPIIIRLPITFVSNGFCGGLAITAKKDLRPFDGGLTEITLFDEKYNSCTHQPPTGTSLNMTLNEEGRNGVKIESHFLGE